MTIVAAIMIATTLQILVKTTALVITSTGGCINQMEGSGDYDANRQGG